MNIDVLKKWFQERQPKWLQKTAILILDKGKLSEEDYRELYKYCVNEVKKPQNEPNNDIPIEKLLNYKNTSDLIKLKYISDIKGINALSPKEPLNFGTANLSVVYGLNGSGKSGYVRILKNICGAKSCSNILPNVHTNSGAEQKCTIFYQKGKETKNIEWKTPNTGIGDLRAISVFDTSCGQVYVENENEITYEPQILSFFSYLVKVCEEISSTIETEKEKHLNKKPRCPDEYKDTEEAKWYNNLSTNTSEEEVNKYCLWTTEDQNQLQELQQRLTQKDPVKKATEIRKQNKHLQELRDTTNNLTDNFSDEKCSNINHLKKEIITAQETAKVVAGKLFEQSPLSGVGSETWKQLWKYAKAYSEHEAYKKQSFPVVSDDALCVLCHQKLDDDAKKRFISFEEFIKGKSQKDVENKKEALEQAIKMLPNILTKPALATKIDASGLQSDSNTELKTLYVTLEKRKQQLTDSAIPPDFSPLPSFEHWKKEIKQTIVDNEQKATQYDEDAKKDNKENLLSKQKQLKAKKWLAEQVTLIKEEIKRLQNIYLLQSAKQLTNTTSLSKKKSELSEQLITKDFIDRFNTELKKLEAEKIKVELSKSKVVKGKALHKIKLKDISPLHSSVKAEDILSEGESRIVALSAFLADVTGGQNSAPFVFDDPISSLDQNYEEAVAKRLVELSQERQVIVFTHRLSFFGLIQEYAKKKDIELNTVCVKKEPWGTGDPGDIPFSKKNLKQALDSLIKNLPQAKECLENKGKDEYNKIAIGLCSDFRITIENTIESVLLMDIVKRHRRHIHTLNKIKHLSKINKEKDCDFLDDLMTKYSKPLHSSTNEVINNIPGPEELKKDFESLKNWIKEFEQRTK